MPEKLRTDTVLGLLGINRKTLQQMEQQHWNWPEGFADRYTFAELEHMRKILTDDGFVTYLDYR